MSETTSYRDKIARLRGELGKAEELLGSEKCIPTISIAAAAAPVLIFLMLFFLSPSFVQRKEGTKYTRCLKRVFMWTVILSILVWTGMYLFSYCAGYSGTAVCARV